MPVKINGSTSGSVTLAAPATGSDVTVTLPAAAGTLLNTPGAWTTFTPTFSGGTWAVGNGTFANCRYTQVGKIVIFTGTFTFGSTTVKDSTSSLSLSIPFASAGSGYGVGEILDTGVANYACQVIVTGSAMFMRAKKVSGTLIDITGFTATNPITWATGDTFSWTVVYEAA